jgi:hypothetical protein
MLFVDFRVSDCPSHWLRAVNVVAMIDNFYITKMAVITVLQHDAKRIKT